MYIQVVIVGVDGTRMDMLADGRICVFDRISKVFDTDVNLIKKLNEIVHPRTYIDLTIDRSDALTWDMKDFVATGMMKSQWTPLSNDTSHLFLRTHPPLSLFHPLKNMDHQCTCMYIGLHCTYTTVHLIVIINSYNVPFS